MSTIKKIAELAKVSIGTVDRVLHDRGNVSEDAENRVLQAIEELNYTPNIFARQLKLSKAFVFGVIMPEETQDNGYWSIPAQGIERAQQELQSHQITVQYFHYDRYDERSFSKCCQNALNAQLDGYLMAPALPEIARKFSLDLPDSIPCVYFDSSVPGSLCLCSIVQDSYTSGVLAARLMHLIARPEAQVAVIRGHEKDYHIQQRIAGFTDYYTEKNLPKPVIVNPMRYGDHDDLQGFFKQFLQEVTELKGLFISDAATYCAARAIKELGMKQQICLIGYDLLTENVMHLRDGTIDFLISQQSKQQGYHGVYALYRHLILKEKLPSSIMMPIDIITKENVDYSQND